MLAKARSTGHPKKVSLVSRRYQQGFSAALLITTAEAAARAAALHPRGPRGTQIPRPDTIQR